VQDLYLDGKKNEAAAALPDALIDGVGLPRSGGADQGAAGRTGRGRRHHVEHDAARCRPAATVHQIERIVELADGL